MVFDVSLPDDPRVSDYRNLRDATLANERGIFIAEGREVVRLLLSRSPLQPRSVMVNASAFETLSEVFARPEYASLPIYRASRVVMDEIVGFPIHRGCLAAGERPSATADGDDWWMGEGDRRGATLVLDGVNNHDNVGGLFRSAAAFGIAQIVLVGDTVDPLYRKAIRVSMGAALLVPYVRITDRERLLRQMNERGVFSVAMTPASDAVDLGTVRLPAAAKGLAIWLGAEGPGLPPEVLGRCSARVRIPMTGLIDSLNVATAGAIAMHSLMELRVV